MPLFEKKRTKIYRKHKANIVYRTNKIKDRKKNNIVYVNLYHYAKSLFHHADQDDDRPEVSATPYLIFKFCLCILFSLIAFYYCFQDSKIWIEELAHYIYHFPSFVVVLSLALIPGFMNMFLLLSFLIDQRKTFYTPINYPDISILIAAYNEEKTIVETLNSIKLQIYPGNLEIILIDDGSTDQTVDFANSLGLKNLTVLRPQHGGKAMALNFGLAHASCDYVVTVDADTILDHQAIYELMKRMLSLPKNTVACAGSVYVKNATYAMISRLQFWDYFLAISIIKRSQSFLNGTLVAQGAFSVYKKSILMEVGGWLSVVGEDIVLTWAFLNKGYDVSYAEKALAFTSVPDNYKSFFFQRARWARGLIESFRQHKTILFRKKFFNFFILWNVCFILIDLVRFIIFLPSLIAMLMGNFIILGPFLIFLFLISLLHNSIYYLKQKKLLNNFGYHIQNHILSFFIYSLFYQFIMNPAVVYGYYQEFFNTKKKWGTK